MPADAAAADFFGYSVALSGRTALVGAPVNGVSRPGAAYVFARSGGAWTQQQKLQAADGDGSDDFGASVALSADTAAVGAPLDDGGRGSGYVFTRAGVLWTPQSKLSYGGVTTAHFAEALALDGDTLVAGAPYDDVPPLVATGAAFVFVRSGVAWSQQQRLTAAGGAGEGRFGSALALSGDTVVAGAWSADTPAGAQTGAAYVFTRASGAWSEQCKLTAADGAADDRFGAAVALSGTTALAGATYHATVPRWRAGAAYAYVRSGACWSAQQQLAGRDNAGGDYFGVALALDGDTLAAGAWLDDTPAGDASGAVVVYTRTAGGWSEQQKLAVTDGERYDSFGDALALDGDTLVAGAPEQDDGADDDVGAAYVFVRSGDVWTLQQKLTPSDGAAAETYFGTALALSGDTLAAGAWGDDTPAGFSTGSAYVFVRAGALWSEQ